MRQVFDFYGGVEMRRIVRMWRTGNRLTRGCMMISLFVVMLTCCMLFAVAADPPEEKQGAAEHTTEVGAEPSATATVAIVPSATVTATAAIEPTATLTLLETNALGVPGVVSVRMADMFQGQDRTFGSFEVDVQPGFATVETAQLLYQVALTDAIMQFGSGNVNPFEFSAILWDGELPAIEFAFSPADDQWRTTSLSITPEQYSEGARLP